MNVLGKHYLINHQKRINLTLYKIVITQKKCFLRVMKRK